jgi:hypothetical protein
MGKWLQAAVIAVCGTIGTTALGLWMDKQGISNQALIFAMAVCGIAVLVATCWPLLQRKWTSDKSGVANDVAVTDDWIAVDVGPATWDKSMNKFARRMMAIADGSRPHERLMIARLTIINRSDTRKASLTCTIELSFNRQPEMFTGYVAKTEDGTVARHIPYPINLGPGETAEGAIAFDVPVAGTDLELRYCALNVSDLMRNPVKTANVKVPGTFPVGS